MMELDALPEGWCLTTLENVADWGSGGTPSRKEASYYGGTVPWVKTGDLGPKILYESSEYISELGVQNSSAKLFPKGAVAIAMYGATIGKTSILGIDATTNQACGVAKPVSGLTFSGFLYYFLLNEKDRFIAKGKGGAQPNISQALLKEHEIVLPPLAEQKVIADKLDTLLAQVESTKARLERIPDILKRFRQSVLTAAVSGRLTDEWRENHSVGNGVEVVDNDAKNKSLLLANTPSLQKKKSSIECAIDSDYIFDLPDSWTFSTWGKVSEWITYGFTKPMPKSDSGVKLLTAKDVQHFQVNINEAGLTTKDAFENLSDKDRPNKGDLLITKDGSIGRAALVRTEELFCINQSVAVCWLRSTKMNKDYLEYLANSEFTQRFVKDKAQGMAIQHLSIIDYAKCPLPVPPLDEQAEIVCRVEQLFTFADSIEQKATAALERVNNLTQSILAKAFRGELTADWRAANPELISGDNSADALLAKIQTERTKPAQRKSRRA
ncbi:restriction endonuclease subunit S [Shewanella algae]|uniref:restriction endonuclease subunit S n=1 Tax=Shewanella algae TaxID=38313 RepID=UPI0031F54FFF